MERLVSHLWGSQADHENFEFYGYNKKRDEVKWGDNHNGCYSVPSSYNSLWILKEKPPWAKAWLPGLIPKINIFYCLALQEKILN